MYKFDPEIIQVGISSCLLGQKVRYDGGHKRSAFCSDLLQKHVEYVPICPEMAIGLGAPRPTIRLQKAGDLIIAPTSDGNEVSQALTEFGTRQATAANGLSGYIFCARSPSCGLERVKLFNEQGTQASKTGTGLYAARFRALRPLLPMEEDGRLNDAGLRENFITRLYAFHDWQCLQHEGLTAAGLISFHSRHKYLLMAHHPASYRRLGPLISDLSNDLEGIAQTYISEFMQAMSHVATRKRHCNVLNHLAGYFKKQLSSRQRQELAARIEDYRQGTLPLLAPITLLRHYLAEFPDNYLDEQTYLSPFPDDMGLRYGI